MPFFRVELERNVSRRAEIRQTTQITVEAPDHVAANVAAGDAARDEQELGKYTKKWLDDKDSYQASNDESERCPTVVRCVQMGYPWSEPWLKIMPEEARSAKRSEAD